MSDLLHTLFRRLSYYIGEGALLEEVEDRIIVLEEQFLENWSILPKDLLWLTQMLKEVRENE